MTEVFFLKTILKGLVIQVAKTTKTVSMKNWNIFPQKTKQSGERKKKNIF